jgi:phytanoyl-CoA hydroxylase
LSVRAESYCTNGYLVAPGLLDPSTVEACRSTLAHFQGHRPGAALLAVPLGSAAFVDSLIGDGRLAGLAAELLGRPAACFGATFVVKAPGVEGAVALWHQDGYPWESALGIDSAVTLWIALDRMAAANGALVVIPGSHSLPAQPLGDGGRSPGGGGGVPGGGRLLGDGVPGGRGVLGAGVEGGGFFGGGIDPALVDEGRAVVLEMEPGDVSAHHPHLIHGSGVNRSGVPRRAMAVRYRPAG